MQQRISRQQLASSDACDREKIRRVIKTHVDVSALEAQAEVVHDRGLVEVRQVGNVAHAVKVGRVDARQEVRLDCARLWRGRAEVSLVQQTRRGGRAEHSDATSSAKRARGGTDLVARLERDGARAILVVILDDPACEVAVVFIWDPDPARGQRARPRWEMHADRRRGEGRGVSGGARGAGWWL